MPFVMLHNSLYYSYTTASFFIIDLCHKNMIKPLRIPPCSDNEILASHIASNVEGNNYDILGLCCVLGGHLK